jgi:hypothetical protein
MLISGSEDCSVILWKFHGFEHTLLHKFDHFASPVVQVRFNRSNGELFGLMHSGEVSLFSNEFLSNKRVTFDRFTEASSVDAFEVSENGLNLFGVSAQNPSDLCVFETPSTLGSVKVQEPKKVLCVSKASIK